MRVSWRAALLFKRKILIVLNVLCQCVLDISSCHLIISQFSLLAYDMQLSISFACVSHRFNNFVQFILFMGQEAVNLYRICYFFYLTRAWDYRMNCPFWQVTLSAMFPYKMFRSLLICGIHNNLRVIPFTMLFKAFEEAER